MPKVNRNDPCPCGSGKKYKNCCMRRDRFGESREISLNPAEAFLLNNLYRYAESDTLQPDLVEAFALYWGGTYDPEGVGELDPDDMRRMYEWFAYDYHTRNERRYVIDLFAETQAGDYPPEVKEVLEAWRHSVMGLFRVVKIAGERLVLHDCLRQGELEVQDAMLARNVQAGDLCIGRLYELGGVKRLSYMTLPLPRAYEQGLVEYVTNAYNRYLGDHGQATWDEFLREYGYLFHAYLLSPNALVMRALIGPGTRFRDPATTRDKLHVSTERRRAEQRREEARADELRPSEHRTATGIILPGAAPEGRKERQDEEAKRPTILIPGRDF